MLPLIDANGTSQVFALIVVAPAPQFNVWFGSVTRTFDPFSEIFSVSSVSSPFTSPITRFPLDTDTSVVAGTAFGSASVHELNEFTPVTVAVCAAVLTDWLGGWLKLPLNLKTA